MIECCRVPSVHRMACRTRNGETSRDMIWIIRSIEISLMAIETIPVKAGKDIVHVAACTLYCLMRTNKRVRRHSMVERGRRPDSRRMALIAGVSEISCEMVGVRRLVKITLVALEAIHEREKVISPRMAGLTLYRCVLSGQRKLRCRMIERCCAPAVHRMARRASGRESACNVIWIRSCVEIRLMTVDAVLVKSCEDVVDVTADAGYRLMRPNERK
jgi:hypothetical protein